MKVTGGRVEVGLAPVTVARRLSKFLGFGYNFQNLVSAAECAFAVAESLVVLLEGGL